MAKITFLRAEWRHLVMLNYTIDPAVLQPLLPVGTELDFHRGETFVSLIGFQFLQTRIFGIPFPFHRNFEEVNLRFYVRRRTPAGWRRGVVFVRELVPRWMIATIARRFYGEPYLALPMRHQIDLTDTESRFAYSWLRAGKWETIDASAQGQPEEMAPGSMEEFITEHYWGYTARGKSCSEYEVEHPRWLVWRQVTASFQAEVEQLYGAPFLTALSAPAHSALVAVGSPVAVRWHSGLFADRRTHGRMGAP